MADSPPAARQSTSPSPEVRGSVPPSPSVEKRPANTSDTGPDPRQQDLTTGTGTEFHTPSLHCQLDSTQYPRRGFHLPSLATLFAPTVTLPPIQLLFPPPRTKIPFRPYDDPGFQRRDYWEADYWYYDSVEAIMDKPTNETFAEYSRQTVDGRTLTYKLHVMQQPERARACGAGAKCKQRNFSKGHLLTFTASADRRPVDPPPVVKLQVFQATADGRLLDITQSHDASFVMYASLAMARKIAQPHPSKTPIPPNVAVLTGQHVAATNYLERPDPAGYFIFPDLSVRHEGHYRLSFNLYEQVKNPEDADPARPIPAKSERPASSNVAQKPRDWDGLQHRLEVCTAPFQVYSAKKFPGLAESTSLSKNLADQGCRVRIRRDVRMRKRKEGKDDYNDVHGFAIPADDFGPGTPVDRRRSMSIHSYHSDPRSVYDGQPPDVQAPPMGPPPMVSAPYQHTPQYPYNQTIAPQYPVPHQRPNPLAPLATSSEALNRRSSGSQPYWHSHSSPRSLPPAIEAEPSPIQETRPQLPQLQSLLQPGQGDTKPAPPPYTTPAIPLDQSSTSRYDPVRRQYSMPDASIGKRAHSPAYAASYSQPMKAGMRPDTVPQQVPQTNGTNRKYVTGAIMADESPYPGDEHFDDPRNIAMTYRRADGKEGTRTVRSFTPPRY